MAVRTTVIGLSISMPLLASLFVGLRIYTRIRLKRMKLDPDDYLAVAALVFCYILSICALIAVFLGGVGEHLEVDQAGTVQDPKDYQTFAKIIWAMGFLIFPSFGLSKLSILFFYKKIFAISRRFVIIAWIAIALIIMWIIAFFFARIFMCVPVEANWRLNLFRTESEPCVDRVMLFWGVTLSDTLTDVFILALPWPEIWGMHLSFSRKMEIAVVFMLGYFVLGADIARLVFSLPVVRSRHVNYDYTYTWAIIINWTIVEVNLSLICACLPTLRPLLTQLKILARAISTPLYGSAASRPHLMHSSTSPADPRPPPRPIFIRSLSAIV